MNELTLYLLRHGESVANVSRVFAAWLFCENHGFKFEDGHMGRGHPSVMSKAGDRFRLLKFDISPDNLSTIRV